MRFFELLQRVRFEDMVPTLKEFCISDRQPVGQLAYYKQAFDCLRLMKPEINDETMRVGTSDGDGDFWARNLGKTIVYNDGLPSDDAVVAAHFLWNCTFYGFTPVAGYNPHSDEENPYWMKSFHILEKDMAFAAHLPMKRYRKMTIFEKDSYCNFIGISNSGGNPTWASINRLDTTDPIYIIASSFISQINDDSHGVFPLDSSYYGNIVRQESSAIYSAFKLIFDEIGPEHYKMMISQ